jgi:hypothetical protein
MMPVFHKFENSQLSFGGSHQPVIIIFNFKKSKLQKNYLIKNHSYP